MRMGFQKGKQLSSQQGGNRYRFENVKQKLSKIEIHSFIASSALPPIYNSSDHMNDVHFSYFSEGLKIWRETDCTITFQSFLMRIGRLSNTLSQVVYHQKEIIQELFSSIEKIITESVDKSSLPTFLKCLALLIHDLQEDYYEPYYKTTIETIFKILKNVIDEAEAIESCFQTLLFLLKTCLKNIIGDFDPTWRLFSDALRTFHKHTYFEKFTVEVFSYILKKVKNEEKLLEIVKALNNSIVELIEASAVEVQEYLESLALLLFSSIRKDKNNELTAHYEMHFKVYAKILMNYPSTFFPVYCNTFLLLLYNINQDDLKIIWDFLLQHTKEMYKSNNEQMIEYHFVLLSRCFHLKGGSCITPIEMKPCYVDFQDYIKSQNKPLADEMTRTVMDYFATLTIYSSEKAVKTDILDILNCFAHTNIVSGKYWVRWFSWLQFYPRFSMWSDILHVFVRELLPDLWKELKFECIDLFIWVMDNDFMLDKSLILLLKPYLNEARDQVNEWLSMTYNKSRVCPVIKLLKFYVLLEDDKLFIPFLAQNLLKTLSFYVDSDVNNDASHSDRYIIEHFHGILFESLVDCIIKAPNAMDLKLVFKLGLRLIQRHTQLNLPLSSMNKFLSAFESEKFIRDDNIHETMVRHLMSPDPKLKAEALELLRHLLKSNPQFEDIEHPLDLFSKINKIPVGLETYREIGLNLAKIEAFQFSTDFLIRLVIHYLLGLLTIPFALLTKEVLKVLKGVILSNPEYRSIFWQALKTALEDYVLSLSPYTTTLSAFETLTMDMGCSLEMIKEWDQMTKTGNNSIDDKIQERAQSTKSVLTYYKDYGLHTHSYIYEQLNSFLPYMKELRMWCFSFESRQIDPNLIFERYLDLLASVSGSILIHKEAFEWFTGLFIEIGCAEEIYDGSDFNLKNRIIVIKNKALAPNRHLLSLLKVYEGVGLDEKSEYIEILYEVFCELLLKSSPKLQATAIQALLNLKVMQEALMILNSSTLQMSLSKPRSHSSWREGQKTTGMIGDWKNYFTSITEPQKWKDYLVKFPISFQHLNFSLDNFSLVKIIKGHHDLKLCPEYRVMNVLASLFMGKLKQYKKGSDRITHCKSIIHYITQNYPLFTCELLLWKVCKPYLFLLNDTGSRMMNNIELCEWSKVFGLVKFLDVLCPLIYRKLNHETLYNLFKILLILCKNISQVSTKELVDTDYNEHEEDISPDTDSIKESKSNTDETRITNSNQTKLSKRSRQLKLVIMSLIAKFYLYEDPTTEQSIYDDLTMSLIHDVLNPMVEPLGSAIYEPPMALLSLLQIWSQLPFGRNYLNQKSLMLSIVRCLSGVPKKLIKEVSVLHILNLISSLFQHDNDSIEPIMKECIVYIGQIIIHICRENGKLSTQQKSLVVHSFDVLLFCLKKVPQLRSLLLNDPQELLLHTLLSLSSKKIFHSLTTNASKASLMTDNTSVLCKSLEVLALVLPFSTLWNHAHKNLKSPLFRALNRSWLTLTETSHRLSFLSLFRSLSASHSELGRAIALVEGLNSYCENAKQIGDNIDYERRQKTFKTIRDTHDWTPLEWSILLPNICFLASNPSMTALSLRHQALFTLEDYLVTVKKSSNSAELIELLNDVVVHWIYGLLVDSSLNDPDGSLKDSLCSLLSDIIQAFPDSFPHAFKELLFGEDEEANVWKNLFHIQLHRRQRAIKRFADIICEVKNVITIRLLKKFCIPLLTHHLEFYTEDNSLATKTLPVRNEAISSIVKLIGLCSPHDLISYTKQYLAWYSEALEISSGLISSSHHKIGQKKGRKPKDLALHQRTLMLLLSGVLEKYPMDTTYLTFLDDFILPKLFDMLIGSQKRLTPGETALASSLLSGTGDKIVRPHIASMITNLIFKFPNELSQLGLSKLVYSCCVFLKNRTEASRDAARLVLLNIVETEGIGYRYLPFVLKEAQTTLLSSTGGHKHHGGYLNHVLGYTLYMLLLKALPTYKRLQKSLNLEGWIDDEDLTKTILSIVLEEVLGHKSKDKETEEWTNKMKEVKAKHGPACLKMLSSIIPLKLLENTIILTIEKAMIEGSDKAEENPKRYYTRVKELMGSITLGLYDNQQVENIQLILPLIYRLLASITEMKKDQMMPVWKAEMALNVLKHLMISKKIFSKDEEDQLAMLDPFLSLLLEIMETHTSLGPKIKHRTGDQLRDCALLSDELLVLIIQCLLGLSKFPLMSLQSTVPKVTMAFSRWLGSANKRHDAWMSPLMIHILKWIKMILRNTSSYFQFFLPNEFIKDLVNIFLPFCHEPLGAKDTEIIWGILDLLIDQMIPLPEIYSLMEKSKEAIILGSNAPQQLQMMRKVYCKFLFKYPLTRSKLLNEYLAPFLTNLEHPWEESRSGLLMFWDLFLTQASKFFTLDGSSKTKDEEKRIKWLSSLYDSLFIHLALRLLNESSRALKPIIMDLLAKIVERLSETQLDQLLIVVNQWWTVFQTASNPSNNIDKEEKFILMNGLVFQVYQVITLNTNQRHSIETNMASLFEKIQQALSTDINALHVLAIQLFDAIYQKFHQNLTTAIDSHHLKSIITWLETHIQHGDHGLKLAVTSVFYKIWNDIQVSESPEHFIFETFKDSLVDKIILWIHSWLEQLGSMEELSVDYSETVIKLVYYMIKYITQYHPDQSYTVTKAALKSSMKLLTHCQVKKDTETPINTVILIEKVAALKEAITKLAAAVIVLLLDTESEQSLEGLTKRQKRAKKLQSEDESKDTLSCPSTKMTMEEVEIFSTDIIHICYRILNSIPVANPNPKLTHTFNTAQECLELLSKKISKRTYTNLYNSVVTTLSKKKLGRQVKEKILAVQNRTVPTKRKLKRPQLKVI